MNSSDDAIKSEPDIESEVDLEPETGIPIDLIKVEETANCEFIYEFLEESELNLDQIEAHVDNTPPVDNRSENEKSGDDSNLSDEAISVSDVTSNESAASNMSYRVATSKVITQNERKPFKRSAPVDDYDPDYIPSIRIKKTNIPAKSKKPDDGNEKDVVIADNKIKLRKYQRTVIRPHCIFVDCDATDTVPVPLSVRRQMLCEYKLYIVNSSNVCKIHLRDQNWEELLRHTYNIFTPEQLQDMVELLQQISQSPLNFEQIEFIPTRLLRYWLNVNKVQFKRIFDSNSGLLKLEYPKAALSYYLMYLQSNDLERMSILLQMPEDELMKIIQSVQNIVTCKTYAELNEKYDLEY